MKLGAERPRSARRFCTALSVYPLSPLILRNRLADFREARELRVDKLKRRIGLLVRGQ